MRFINFYSAEGHIPFKATCEGQVTKPQHPDHYISFEDDSRSSGTGSSSYLLKKLEPSNSNSLYSNVDKEKSKSLVPHKIVLSDDTFELANQFSYSTASLRMPISKNVTIPTSPEYTKYHKIEKKSESTTDYNNVNALNQQSTELTSKSEAHISENHDQQRKYEEATKKVNQNIINNQLLRRESVSMSVGGWGGGYTRCGEFCGISFRLTLRPAV